MFLPLPFFWALFDMQGSRWTISATQMNGWQGGDKFKMRPDQIQILNPIMILLFLPLFSKVIIENRGQQTNPPGVRNINNLYRLFTRLLKNVASE